MKGIDSRLPMIAALALVLAMLASLGWQGWQFYQAEQSREAQRAVRTEAQQPAASQQRATVNLPEIDLFGAPGAQAQAAPQSTENLPETNLRLFLRGVMAGDENSLASALIEGSDSRTEAYAIGDELPGDAKLRSVYANRVIIERSGKLENLYFPELSDRGGIDVTGGSPEPDAGQPAPPPASSRAARPSPSASAVSGDRREEIRRRLEDLRERLRQNSN
ncbi:type II secretion system protein N [Marinobacter fonticola]|uniref:type II secretion system protein N n=1 Tax=Marinobacter fonticola TaxID=2603215 RepID=UPI0011E813C7|nr:type II secretion system protein N [Marinobacter fonticola]